MNLFVAKKDLYTVFVFSIDKGKWKNCKFPNLYDDDDDDDGYSDGAYEY